MHQTTTEFEHEEFEFVYLRFDGVVQVSGAFHSLFNAAAAAAGSRGGSVAAAQTVIGNACMRITESPALALCLWLEPASPLSRRRNI